MNQKIEAIIQKFSPSLSWDEKYKALIQMGKTLPALQDKDKIEENLIRGCQSQVWLLTEFKDGRIYFYADSDALITKGIVALLVDVYTGLTPDEVLGTKPDFLETIGIRDHLSMNRSNGLASMIKKIMFYAVAYKAKNAQQCSL